MAHAKKRTKKKTASRRRTKKPAKSTPKRGQPFKDREPAFQFWCQCENVRATARQFNISPTTIYKIMREDAWRDRLPDVIDQVRAQSEKQAARKISDNLSEAKTILARVVTALDSGNLSDVSVGDFVKLARYIDEFEGTAPGLVAAEQLNDVIANLATGSDAERSRVVGNALAGLGITDRATVKRAAKIWLGRASTSN